jgi:hypothetical protein
MTNVSSSNAPHSDAMLPTVPQKTHQYNTTDEGVFLTQQATDAKTAMQRTLADMQATVKEAADVRWWTQQYPWYAVGAAAAVGFVTASQVLAPPDHRAPPAPPPQGQSAGRPSWMSSLFALVRSTLMGALAEAMQASSQHAKRAQTEQAQAHTDVC